MPIFVVVLSSVRGGFLLLHIVRKCRLQYMLNVVTEYMNKDNNKNQMDTEIHYIRIRVFWDLALHFWVSVF